MGEWVRSWLLAPFGISVDFTLLEVLQEFFTGLQCFVFILLVLVLTQIQELFDPLDGEIRLSKSKS